MNELLEIELPEGDYDTLGSFVIAQLDRIPGGYRVYYGLLVCGILCFLGQRTFSAGDFR
jgi:CBS domain containing-hemolysin-like protein